MERYEIPPHYPLELGVAKFQKESITADHYIVEEYIDLANGIYVYDNREKFIGESQLKTESDIHGILEQEVDDADFVVGHALESDWDHLPERIAQKSTGKVLDAQDF